MWVDHLSVICQGGSSHHHLDGGYRYALPEGIGPKFHRSPVAVTGEFQTSGGFTCQVNPGRMPEAKALHVRIKARTAHLFVGDPGKADVERVSQAAGHILITPGAAVPVINFKSTDYDGLRDKRDGILFYNPTIQCAGHGKDFRNGAWFICLADCPVERL